jgi:hypothetical protein
VRLKLHIIICNFSDHVLDMDVSEAVSTPVIRLCSNIPVILLATFIDLVFWSNCMNIEPEMRCVVVIP